MPAQYQHYTTDKIIGILYMSSSYFMSSGGGTDTIFSASSVDTAGSVVVTVFFPQPTFAYVTTPYPNVEIDYPFSVVVIPVLPPVNTSGAPVLANDTGTPGDNITNDPTIVYPTPAAGDALVYRLDGGSFTTTVPTFATDGSADGSHTVSIQERDGAGNVVSAGSLTFTLDTIAPLAPTSIALVQDTGASSTDRITSDLQLFVVPAETSGILFANLGDDVFPARFADGPQTVTVEQQDVAGNHSATVFFSYVYDATAPAAPAAPVLAHDTGVAGDNVTRDPTIIYPTPASGDVLLYRLDGGGYTTTAPVLATDGSAEGSHTVSIAEQDIAGNVSLAVGLTFTLDTRIHASNDFSGNDHSGLLWQNSDGTVAITSIDGLTVTSSSTVSFNPGAAWHAVGTGDFDGDGKADILWQNADGTPAVWLMDGSKILSGANVGFNPGASWHVIGSGDFDGDGKADILWQNNDGQAAIWLMDGLSIKSGSDVGFNPGPSWHVIGSGDFDGDGKADILWQNNNGQAAIWLMDGQSLKAGGKVGFNPGADWHVQGAGDFNGDGKADILWQNANGQAAIWEMNGLNLLSGSNVGFNPGAAWQVHGSGDFNGDGKADIEWQNTDGTTAVWLMDGFDVVSGSNVGSNPGASWHVVPQHHDLLV
jgi:hypothetical protein